MEPEFAARWRALGRPEDLDVPLDGASWPVPRPELVTRVLAACRADDASGDDAWDLTLGGRIGGLAAVLARSGEPLRPQLRCPEPGCGEAFEVELPLERLVAMAEEAERERAVVVPLARRPTLRLRRPTGRDQLRWSARRFASTAEAERALLGSLVVEPADGPGPLTDAELSAVSAAMEEADPLPSFRVASACPACAAQGEHALDLEGLLLALLARRQRALIHDVHRLAAEFGWSEADVLAIPEWRRRAYLRLLAGETS